MYRAKYTSLPLLVSTSRSQVQPSEDITVSEFQGGAICYISLNLRGCFSSLLSPPPHHVALTATSTPVLAGYRSHCLHLKIDQGSPSQQHWHAGLIATPYGVLHLQCIMVISHSLLFHDHFCKGPLPFGAQTLEVYLSP
jgi:hypothetical protein